MTEPNKFFKAALRVAELVYEKEKCPSQHNGHAAVVALEEAAKILDLDGYGSFGVESVSIPNDSYGDISSRSFSYLNMGDTYALTIGWDETSEEFLITTWGDWYEQAEQAYQEDTDTYRCGYCGAFTDKQEGIEWHDTICECCGHCVDGSDTETVYALVDDGGNRCFEGRYWDTSEEAWAFVEENGLRDTDYDVESIKVRKG